MPTKRSIIVALVGINLFLLGALVLSSHSLPVAYAQRAGHSNNYLSVTCQVDQGYDVFYIVDLETRQLHAFWPDRAAKGTLKYVGGRDLESDFSRGQ